MGEHLPVFEITCQMTGGSKLDRTQRTKSSNAITANINAAARLKLAAAIGKVDRGPIKRQDMFVSKLGQLLRGIQSICMHQPKSVVHHPRCNIRRFPC